MKNPLKAPGNKYEIDNEIPKVQEWKIHWKRQGIDMKLTMKYPRYKNEKSIESAREYIWNLQWKSPSYQNEISNEIP